MKDKIKLRVLVKEVVIRKDRGRWSDPSYTSGRQEVLQRWDSDNGWVDIPKVWDHIFIEKNK